MPVRQDVAYPLLNAFGRLEFQLKRRGDYFRASNGHVVPDVAWRRVETTVRRMDVDFTMQVPDWARWRLLSERQTRPMRQQVVEENGRQVARFRPNPLDDNDAVALVQAMRQVRNNLFHGGKEDTEDDPYAEDDYWAEAATAVALVLLRLAEGPELAP
ncbi:hypothetical protein [Xanthomonas bundabergensis]|uniref:hypothetical protein n=1 Tax=Xanthomonas bundabergensis TaxID=3160842 RepID=UPI003516CFC6